MKVTVIPIVIGALGTIPKFGKGVGRAGNLRTSRVHPNFSIVKINQNTEKSPGDLRRHSFSHSFSQTPLKDHLSTLM